MITVTTEEGNIVSIPYDPEAQMDNLRLAVQAELGIPADEVVFLLNGKVISPDATTASQAGIKDEDLVLVTRKPKATPPPRTQTSGTAIPGANPAMLAQAEQFIAQLQGNRYLYNQIKEQHPELAQAVDSRDVNRVVTFLVDQERQKREVERRKALEIARLNADPLDLDAQAKIAEDIRMENVQSNMDAAWEHTPESFGSVVMLYVPVKVNGRPIQAFVDSGAQMSIMSERCAERCGLLRLLDRRWGGMAKGVGESKIVGRIHMVMMEMGGHHFPVSISVLENQTMDFLFGLDMLRRHQCVIDLNQNKLIIGEASVSFLGEGELDKNRWDQQEVAEAEASASSSTAAHNLHSGDGSRNPPSSVLTPPSHPDPITSTPSPATRGPHTATPPAARVTTPQTPSMTSLSTPGAPLVRPPNPEPSPLQPTTASSDPTPPAGQPQSHSQPGAGMEEGIRVLMETMGVNRQQAMQALISAGGNVDIAANLLFDL
eukprot:Rmarinus@m.27817